MREVAKPEVCADVAAVCARISDAAVVLVAEEALAGDAVSRIAVALQAQESWSDLPIIVLMAPKTTTLQNRRSLAALVPLGNVSTLERPIHQLTLVSAVRAALRARARQYDTRTLLVQRETALRQRDAFLAMLGHELRGPLGAMRNALELATDESTRDGALAVLGRQTRILARLVDDLLDVARVTSGKVVLDERPVDLVGLVERIVSQTRSSADRDIGLMRPSRKPLVMVGDEVRLEQIFANLLSNAVKYTPEPGRIAVRIDDLGDRARVTVADAGLGISPAALPRIFELFEQSHATLARSDGGMGIGLTLVRDLVRLHGGTVTARSEGIGRGSEFTVELPLARRELSAVEPASVPDAAALRVLVMEDNQDSRTTLRDLLEFDGHVVDVAATGVEGIERALQAVPDVALIDIGLPELDGYEVARRLRAALGTRVTLIAASGYGQPDDVRRAHEAGFDAHLVKPFDLDRPRRLLAAVRR